MNQKYYGTNRASKYIYGIILMLVFVISQSHGSGVSAASLAVLSLFASFTFSFAEIYAEILGERIKNKGSISKNERQSLVSDSFAMVSTGVLVSVIFIISALDFYSLKTAFDISYLILLVMLFSFSFWAYKISGFSTLKATLISCVSVFIGTIIIFLKYIAGH